MLRSRSAVVLLALFLIGHPIPSLAQSPSAPPASAVSNLAPPITPAEAAPFLGDWSIPVEVSFGTFYGSVTLKVEDGIVVALLRADVVPEQRSTDITKAGNGIRIRSKMDYQGPLVEKSIPVSLVLTLTPSGDAAAVGLDFTIGTASFLVSATGKRLQP